MSYFEKEYSFDTALENDGAWVDLCKGVRICIRSAWSETAREGLETMRAPYQHWLRNRRSMPDSIADSIFSDWLAEHILVDWQGVTLDDKPVPCTPSTARSVLLLYPHFKDDIAYFSKDRETFRPKPKN